MNATCWLASSVATATSSELATDLATRLRTGADPAFAARAWQVLVAVARDDLAITKPGHDASEGQ